ncbi:MAG: ATP-binding protein [Bdellovibrio sp.]
MKTDFRDGICFISVSDNGPGVSAEILPRLFQKKATHGKPGGSGLGLYQVRKELEIYGGKVVYTKNEDISCFEIRLPLDLERVDFTVNPNVVILESHNQISSYLGSDINNGVIIHRYSSVGDALEILKRSSSREWTVFADLVLSSDEESGFDLIEKISIEHTGKIVLCTSLSDNKEIQAMSHKYHAILISYELLARIRLKL